MNEQVKKCSCCAEEKPLSQFVKDISKVGGYKGQCRLCLNDRRRARNRGEDMPRFRRKRITAEERREYSRQYWHNRISDPVFLQKELARQRVKNRAFRKVDRLKRRAHKMVENAIKAGRLIRQGCEHEGCQEIGEAHHEDYAKPLDVRWLCRLHHMEHHRKND